MTVLTSSPSWLVWLANTNVIRMARIGQSTSQSPASAAAGTSTQPLRLKVELATRVKSDKLLEVAKMLKKDQRWSKVYVTQWLSKEEVANVRSLRQRCHQLNNKSQSLADGRNRSLLLTVN